MNLLARLGQARIAAEIRFVLGGALAGAGAGLLPGLLSGGSATHLAGGDPVVALIVGTARGIGTGWWVGLLWSVVFAVLARNMTPPAPVAALSRAAWVAAATVVLGCVVGHLLGEPVARGVLGGVLAGTFVARLVLIRAGKTPAP